MTFRLNDISMKPKLITLFTLAAIIPLAIGCWWAVNQATKALCMMPLPNLKQSEQLKAIRSLPFLMNGLEMSASWLVTLL